MGGKESKYCEGLIECFSEDLYKSQAHGIQT